MSPSLAPAPDRSCSPSPAWSDPRTRPEPAPSPWGGPEAHAGTRGRVGPLVGPPVEASGTPAARGATQHEREKGAVPGRRAVERAAGRAVVGAGALVLSPLLGVAGVLAVRSGTTKVRRYAWAHGRADLATAVGQTGDRLYLLSGTVVCVTIASMGETKTVLPLLAAGLVLLGLVLMAAVRLRVALRR